QADGAARRRVGVIVDADAVEAIVVLVRARAADRDLRSESAIAAVVQSVRIRLRADRVDARLQRSELRPIAAVQRKLARRFTFNYDGHGIAAEFDSGRLVADFEGRGGGVADLQLHIENLLFANGERKSRTLLRREAGGDHIYLIVTRQQISRIVNSALIRRNLRCDAG